MNKQKALRIAQFALMGIAVILMFITVFLRYSKSGSQTTNSMFTIFDDIKTLKKSGYKGDLRLGLVIPKAIILVSLFVYLASLVGTIVYGVVSFIRNKDIKEGTLLRFVYANSLVFAFTIMMAAFSFQSTAAGKTQLNTPVLVIAILVALIIISIVAIRIVSFENKKNEIITMSLIAVRGALIFVAVLCAFNFMIKGSSAAGDLNSNSVAISAGALQYKGMVIAHGGTSSISTNVAVLGTVTSVLAAVLVCLTAFLGADNKNNKMLIVKIAIDVLVVVFFLAATALGLKSAKSTPTVAGFDFKYGVGLISASILFVVIALIDTTNILFNKKTIVER